MIILRQTSFWLLMTWAVVTVLIGATAASDTLGVAPVLMLFVLPLMAFFPRMFAYFYSSTIVVILPMLFCGLVSIWYVWAWALSEATYTQSLIMSLPLYQLLFTFVAYKIFITVTGREPKELLAKFLEEGLFWDRIFFMVVILGSFLIPALLIGAAT